MTLLKKAEEEEEAGVLLGRLDNTYHLHNVQNGDWSRQDDSDDKQPKWLPRRDQNKRSEELWRTSSTLEQSSLSMDQNPRFFAGYNVFQTTSALSRLKIISHLGGRRVPQMTLQQYLSILPCLPLPSGNLQTPIPPIP